MSTVLFVPVFEDGVRGPLCLYLYGLIRFGQSFALILLSSFNSTGVRARREKRRVKRRASVSVSRAGTSKGGLSAPPSVTGAQAGGAPDHAPSSEREREGPPPLAPWPEGATEGCPPHSPAPVRAAVRETEG